MPLISVYCTADDRLPERPRNARRKLCDAEVVTLFVAQVLMGIPSDRRFLRAARRQIGHLFPCLPSPGRLHKRLGHASPKITLDVYAHLFDAAEHGKRASDALEAAMGNSVVTAGGDGWRDPPPGHAAEVVDMQAFRD